MIRVSLGILYRDFGLLGGSGFGATTRSGSSGAFALADTTEGLLEIVLGRGVAPSLAAATVVFSLAASKSGISRVLVFLNVRSGIG